MDTIILGGGISGLTVATRLKQKGKQLCLIEAGNSIGGAVGSRRQGDYLAERGPNSFMLNDSRISKLLEDIGLTSRIQAAQPEAKKRFIIYKGKAVAIPMSPLGAVATPLLRLGSKLQLLGEPLRGKGTSTEESLAHFVERRLGSEVLERFVEPFINGIYAGDPAQLSVRHAFPMLWELEQQHGSLIKGAIAKGKARKANPGTRIRSQMISFPDGMAELPAALAKQIGTENIHTQARITRIMPPSAESAEWQVSFQQGDNPEQTLSANKLICAVPANRLHHLPWPAELSQALNRLKRIPYPPVTSVALAFPRSAITHPLDGFGFLVPPVEQRRVLGTLFSSSIFTGRAPEGHVLLTTFVGGTRQPENAALEDSALIQCVCEELQSLLGLHGEPGWHSITRWPEAIPQYALDYQEVYDALDAAEAQHSGLHFCGNYRNGIAVGHCLINALELAEGFQ